jgi:hypothetical protein
LVILVGNILPLLTVITVLRGIFSLISVLGKELLYSFTTPPDKKIVLVKIIIVDIFPVVFENPPVLVIFVIPVMKFLGPG